MGHEYLTDKRLRVLDPQVHSQYKNCVVVSNQMLSQYQSTFPEYTDHSTLHNLEIVDTCNALIGDQIERLTAEVLHDCRMVVSERTSFTIQQQRIILDLNSSLMLV